MNHIFRTAAILATVWCANVQADGLLYQLPDDGAWVKYEMKVSFNRGGQLRDMTGNLRMSSVGTSKEKDVDCRWIEVRMTMKNNDAERVIVCKVLCPESELKEGGNPLEKRVRGWIQMNPDSDAIELDDDNVGPMVMFLAKTLSDREDVDPVEIDSKLGKASCPGVKGTLKWKEGSRDNEGTVLTRRHPKAPFGVVSSQMTVTVSQDGDEKQSGKMNFKLSDFGFDAKSDLPDKQ